MASSILSFNPDDLTVGDMEDFEDITGVPIDEALRSKPVLCTGEGDCEHDHPHDEGKVVKDKKGRPVKALRMSPKTLKAFVFLVERKRNPEFTLEDARNTRVSAFNLDGGDDSPEGPAAATKS